LVLEGVDIKTAQTMLGHSNPRLTLGLYAQSSNEAARVAADRIRARFLARPRPQRAHEREPSG
jgi:hypothetical protein